MTSPEEDFATEHERWAEQQAVMCERHIAEIFKSVEFHIAKLTENHRQKRPGLDYLHLTTGPLHECAVRINAYAQQADNLRRGREARLEAERYQEHAR